jgi:transposase InsO family protein
MRFRKHKILLKPKKCAFGLTKIEFVGHTISEEGVSFSREKLQEVLDFPRPVTQQQLRQFIGLANYYRDHVKNHSDKARPLIMMFRDYEKRKKIVWTPEAIQAFETLQKDVSECHTLFFVDESAPIFLCTDASDYGIGGYLYQVIDGKERPVGIFSKSLHDSELKWSVPEKECYAIYFALKKWEYLLRNVQFTIKTDHLNLTYLNMEGSPKVKRWRTDIQEFDFFIEHIPGEDNIVADATSRLCAKESQQILMLAPIQKVQIPRDKYRIISKYHNSVSGHFGYTTIMRKLRAAKYKWTGMGDHVKIFLKTCALCQKMSQVKPHIYAQPFTAASYSPMDTLNVDSIGPVTTDIFGNCYIIVIICCFTRFVELYAAPDTSALSAARALLNHHGRYGVPNKIRTDRGSQYVNELIQKFCTLVGTEMDPTTAYSKEENGIVERANKEVMRHLRAIIFDRRITDTWSSDYLPLVQRIMNAQIKSPTGVSPAQLLFGDAVHLERGILLPHKEVSEGEDIPVYLKRLLSTQSDLIKIAQENQKMSDNQHMANAKPQRTEFPKAIMSFWIIQGEDLKR